jgi:5-methylcytosine-specific restriction endonuclease McrA
METRLTSPEAGIQERTVSREKLKREIIKRSQYGRCLICGRLSRRNNELEIHHIRRRAHGGGDARSNLFAVCWADHRRIHMLADLAQQRPVVSRVILAVQVSDGPFLPVIGAV